MRRWLVAIVLCFAPRLHAATSIRCDDAATGDLIVDGLLDDWKGHQILARAGAAPDGAIALRCAWDGTALALALDIADDRVVRVRSGKGHEDHVDLAIASGDPLPASSAGEGRRGSNAAAGASKNIAAVAYPGNSIAKAKLVAPAKVELADSLQPKGFSLEMRVPAKVIPGFSTSTPTLELHVVFHDSDAATGGQDHDVDLAVTIELGDRKDLLDDFLRTVSLKRSDIVLDTLAELDPDHRGKERLVAGGTVIGVLTDQFAYVSLPAQKASDVRSVALLAMGTRGEQIVSAVVRQSGNGGTRDLLLLWTVWSGQLSPLVQIEVRKEQNGKILESQWKIAKAKKGAELWVEPKPAVGWTAQTWNEQSADDADSILVPWDAKRGGIAYRLNGKDIARRDLPAKKPASKKH